VCGINAHFKFIRWHGLIRKPACGIKGCAWNQRTEPKRRRKLLLLVVFLRRQLEASSQPDRHKAEPKQRSAPTVIAAEDET
jgi:hypothetical protein